MNKYSGIFERTAAPHKRVLDDKRKKSGKRNVFYDLFFKHFQSVRCRISRIPHAVANIMCHWCVFFYHLHGSVVDVIKRALGGGTVKKNHGLSVFDVTSSEK